MARGNWNCQTIKPATKCRLCGLRVSKKDFVRLEGIRPAHRDCATNKNMAFSEGDQLKVIKG
jgi:hypothetical protein